MVFGVFDDLHEGHHYFLEQAKLLGDYLIVVVAMDEMVQKLKHKKSKRTLAERIAKIEGKGIVDEVVPGDSVSESWDVIKLHKPSVIAVGHDQDKLYLALMTQQKTFNSSLEVKKLGFFNRNI